VNPTVPINGGAAQISGRSIVNDRALLPEAQEHIPVTENIRALRAALNTLGDGFVEAIDDSTLLAIAARQPDISAGRIHGEAIEVRMRPRFMHDLKSLTLQDAIERHEGEAEHVIREFRELSHTEKQQLISFLESL
jgi:CxxC motif-containing protein (DUF1111 family)